MERIPEETPAPTDAAPPTARHHPASARRNPNPCWRRALYLLLVWIAIIGLAEVVLGGAGFGPHAVQPPARMDKFRPDEQLIWALKPSWTGVEPNGAMVRTNALGLRGPELATDPPWRIVMVGDSVTYGHYLEQDATVPHRLELELNRGRETPIEVVNAGVAGARSSMRPSCGAKDRTSSPMSS